MAAEEVPVQTCRPWPAPFAGGILLLMISLGLHQVRLAAATVVSGEISGTWTAAQSPYILSGNCTVGTNQVLTIEPGVKVIIGPSLQVFVYGGIVAVGTPAQPIFIQGTSPTNRWDSISLSYSGFTNRFENCRFRDANGDALFFDVEGKNRIWTAEILQCEFINCGTAIAGSVYSRPTGDLLAGGAEFDPEIRNCVFDSVGWGCNFNAYWPGTTSPTPFLKPHISGNLFKQVQWSAITFSGSVDSTNATSRPIVVNNTIVNSGRGIDIEYYPCDPVIRNNLFLRTTNAIYRTGSAFPIYDANYNCFFGNKTDFFGYPGVYGFNVQTNLNGDLCDAFFNIFMDPGVIDPSRYLLSPGSPCVDAGDPAIADECFTFSLGTAASDIGAYGGPSACGWLLDAFAPTVSVQSFAGLTFTGLVSHTYSIDYVTSVTATNWTGLATNTLTQPVWTFIDTNSPAGTRRFYRVTLQR